MNKKQFLQIWANHGLLTVLFKVFNFFILNTLLQQYITLEEFPLYGALIYLPTVVLLFIVPKLLEKTNVFTALKRCLDFILILFLGFWFVILTEKVPLDSLLVLLACVAFLASMESIFFDKVTATYCAYKDLPFVITTTRLANTLGYIIGPLIGSFFFNKLSFANLLVTSMVVILIYRIFLLLVHWNLQKNVSLQSQFHSQGIELTVSRQSILYLYSLNFMWLNLVAIMIIPFYSLYFSVSQIGVILSFAGVGMLAGNLFSISLFRRFNYLLLFHIAALGLLFNLCMAAFLGSNYFWSCFFIGLGSFFSSVCYALAQYFSLSIVDSESLSHFYGIRNFINTLISLVLFILLWCLVSSSLSHVLRDFFNIQQASLMSLFFLLLAFICIIFYAFNFIYSRQLKECTLS
ncbi:MFS transporter [Legionella rowbothamii]|uniref:MFS transporter n=1 Tax=Legionella rowbothamii TaxID=96229 RepID=UPI001054BF70|nr:MFS transporter [Legionella rowbothamii]